ncbi:unnamed protein product, partial [Didymodactylos carnosus]
YYTKAAAKGNAEGIYNLARMADRGQGGIKKDHQMALELFQKAASKPPYHPKIPTLRMPGVAEAEHALGLRYEEGVVVKKNLKTAAYWYERGMNHGLPSSANNLAIMYENGLGVEKNTEKSEQLFEFAATKGDPNAMLSLALCLLERNQFQIAREWHRRACDAGHISAQLNQEQFHAAASQKESSTSQMHPVSEIKQHASSAVPKSNVSDRKYECSEPQYHYDTLKEHALRGSRTAQRLCKALEHFHTALKMLMSSDAETNERQFIHEMAECIRLEPSAVELLGLEIDEKIEEVINRSLKRKPNDEETQMCYVSFFGYDTNRIIEYLKQCIKQNPKCVYFYISLAAADSSLDRFEKALESCNVGLSIDPTNCELMCMKADFLRLLENDAATRDAIEVYKAFLVLAPNDHPKVPKAYYGIVTCYLTFQSHLSEQSAQLTMALAQAQKLYEKGLEAEKLQLPCYMPYHSAFKEALQELFDEDSEVNSDSNETLVSPAPEMVSSSPRQN